MSLKLPTSLTDSPFTQLKNWLGFGAKKDKTMYSNPQILVEPSQNCFIPDSDKIVPRDGSQIAFQGEDDPLNVGVIGKNIKFKNFYAIEMDVKAYRDATEGEQVYVLFEGVYVPITINPNTSLNGTDKIYFTTYTDANLDLSQNKRLPRLLWVNGYEHTDGTGRVFSWTGGITALATIAANVITCPTGLTWRKLGFTENFPNTTQIRVTINGVEFFSTSVAELDTDTLTLNANPTAVVGDIVTSAVEVDELVAPMDHIKQNKNYAYYGNFMFRQWWMSNKYGRPSVTRLTSSNAQQDDLIISDATNYTGTGSHTYKFVIDSITPATNAQDFSSNGGSNSGSFDTSGFSISGKHKYIISIVSDVEITPVGASVSGVYSHGQVFEGATSGSRVQLVAFVGGSVVGGAHFKLLTPGVYPSFGETFNDVTNPANTFDMLDNALLYNTAILYKDGTQVITGGMFDGVIQLAFTGPYTLVDGLTFVIATAGVGGNVPGDYYTLEIQTEEPDTFTWQKDNGVVSAPQDVQTSDIAIQDGIVIRWASDTGHKVGDYWIINVNQEIRRPWANFYYTIDLISQNSVRRPGEGYIYDLSSNFWTSDTLEDSIYANMSNGDWGYTNPTLSADLLSEDITFIPLKNVVASRVLYPYLTGHNRNDLIFIDENKSLVSIGRLQLIEKIQMNDMSDFVQNMFRAASFLDGSIQFQDDKTWITTPHENRMFCYDERTKYWQPPQVIPNLGLLTTIGTQLYVHSYLNTGTRRLNDPTAIGDDGSEYEVIAQSTDYDHGNRWIKKAANMGFWEGRIFEDLPEGTMKFAAIFGPDGCQAVKETDLIPKFCCEETNQGNFGGGNDGDHELGGDVTVGCDYATYQYDKMGPIDFYFSSVRFKCRTVTHRYEILSMGINLAESKFNNKQGRPAPALDDLLPINQP